MSLLHTIAFTASTRLATASMPDGRPSMREMLLAWGWDILRAAADSF
jgi:hypothetical protein